MDIVLRIQIPFYELQFDARLPVSIQVKELILLLSEALDNVNLDGFQMYSANGEELENNQLISDLHLHNGSQVMIL